MRRTKSTTVRKFNGRWFQLVEHNDACCCNCDLWRLARQGKCPDYKGCVRTWHHKVKGGHYGKSIWKDIYSAGGTKMQLWEGIPFEHSLVRYCIEEDGEYAVIYGLYVPPMKRRQGEGRLLMEAVIGKIKALWPGIPIKLDAEPFGVVGLDRAQLISFYSDFDIELL